LTATIDFGLVLLEKLRGDEKAKLTQLAMECAPSLHLTLEARKPPTRDHRAGDELHGGIFGETRELYQSYGKMLAGKGGARHAEVGFR